MVVQLYSKYYVQYRRIAPNGRNVQFIRKNVDVIERARRKNYDDLRVRHSRKTKANTLLGSIPCLAIAVLNRQSSRPSLYIRITLTTHQHTTKPYENWQNP
jgi:hypothetical protein